LNAFDTDGLSFTTGAEKFGGPVNISGSVPGTGAGSKKGVVSFDPLGDIQLPLGNNGKAAMTVSSVSITGANAADFTQTNTCPATLKPATELTVTVTFKASVLGPETAYVTFIDSTTGSPHNMYLLGIGK
jgi:hypothetical protein